MDRYEKRDEEPAFPIAQLQIMISLRYFSNDGKKSSCGFIHIVLWQAGL
jgi:hypothetical protein